MTTKPKARKFRIRRTPASQPGPVSDTAQTPSEDPRQDQQYPGPQSSGSSSSYTSEPASAAYDPETETETRAGMVSSASEMGASRDIDAIRNEGLTGRQLRMARRMAQKHGLAPTSDFDAVRLLRAKGVSSCPRRCPRARPTSPRQRSARPIGEPPRSCRSSATSADAGGASSRC